MAPFLVSPCDNDSYAFRRYPQLMEYQRVNQIVTPNFTGALNSNVRRCDICHELLEKHNTPLTELVITKRTLDISITYDGIYIASNRFRRVYEKYALKGLKLSQLPNDIEFFSLKATRSLEFDTVRRKTRFVDKCSHCGLFESVVGATPVFLKPGYCIEEQEFVRSDLEFGSGDEKHPLLMCGGFAASVLIDEGLGGLNLESVATD